MINQLRLYDVDPALEGPFLDRSRDHAQRIMTERYGFRILAKWMSREAGRLRFVYLLAWNDEEEMRRQWAAFLADAEWDRIKVGSRIGSREPVQAVEDIPLRRLLGPAWQPLAAQGPGVAFSPLPPAAPPALRDRSGRSAAPLDLS